MPLFWIWTPCVMWLWNITWVLSLGNRYSSVLTTYVQTEHWMDPSICVREQRNASQLQNMQKTHKKTLPLNVTFIFTIGTVFAMWLSNRSFIFPLSRPPHSPREVQMSLGFCRKRLKGLWFWLLHLFVICMFSNPWAFILPLNMNNTISYRSNA